MAQRPHFVPIGHCPIITIMFRCPLILDAGEGEEAVDCKPNSCRRCGEGLYLAT